MDAVTQYGRKGGREMTKEEKQKAINALKISAPIVAVTQEEFKDYIQTLNKIMDWLEQEPTTENNLDVDCIDRKALLNRLNDFNEWCKDSRLPGSMFAVDVIKDMPPVTPQPRWIPISEKWPEDCQEVFVTTDEGDIVTDVFHVDSGGYYFEDRDVEYVTAWMPLFIKPYKVEREDKE